MTCRQDNQLTRPILELSSLRSSAARRRIMESWNDGFKETSIQNVYYLIDFLVLMAYFTGKKPENRCLRALSKRVDSTFFYRIIRFPLFMPNIPTFQHSVRLNKKMAVQNTVILSEAETLQGVGSTSRRPINCRNSDTLNYYSVSHLLNPKRRN